MPFVQDARFALRVFRKNPEFTAVAVLTLALGIGGNTALFSLVDQLLLRDLPVRDAGQLITLTTSTPRFKDQPLYSIRDYEAFQRATHAFSDVAATRVFQRFTVEANGMIPEIVSGEYVSGNYYSLLGIQPLLGRLIEPADDANASGGVAVLSFGCWRRRFGGDPAVIGKVIRVDSRPVTIIGVTPPRFYGLNPGYAPEFRLPMSAQAAPLAERQRQVEYTHLVIGRLRQGVSLTQAEAYLRPLYAAREQEKAQFLPEAQRNTFLARNAVLEVKEANHGLYGLNRIYAQPLWIVFAVAGAVLLAACVNLAGLLLSQTERRRHETAVRLALGASRSQILRMVRVESLLLSVFGALLGALFAGWASSLLTSFVPAGGFPRVVPIEIGSGLTLRTFLFLSGMCFLTTLLFGLTPAARAARQEAAPALKSEPSVTTLGRRWSLRNLLLAAQVALSLVIVLGAATLIGSLKKLLAEHPGYLTDKLLMVTVDPLKGRYRQEQAHQFFDQLLPRVAGLPVVQSVSLARYNPLGPTFAVGAMPITVEGHTSKAEENYPKDWPVRNVVAPHHFQTLGIPLLRGRDFTAGDGPNSPKVAIINERFAQHYFGGGNPLGRRIGWNGRADIEVVGVVGNSKYADLHESAKPYWYIPYAQLGPDRWQQMTIQARIAGNAGDVAAAIRKQVADLDPSLPVVQMSTIETEINYHLSRERLVATLGGFFGTLAALLAAIGTYGVASQAVTRRTKEIGIRLALGAGRGQIVRTVITDVAFMVALGIAIGLPFMWTWRALLASFVYGVAPTDPWIVTLALGIVAGVALAAACGPVRRSAKVDPMITLRYE